MMMTQIASYTRAARIVMALGLFFIIAGSDLSSIADDGVRRLTPPGAGDASPRSICACDPKYGIDATGTRDATAGIITALADAKAAGISLQFPEGKYKIVTGSIKLDSVSIVGPHIANVGAPYQHGATFLLFGTTASPFILGRRVTLEGLSFFWPEQDDRRPTPVAYPPLFDGSYITQFEFRYNTVVNGYRFFRSSSGGSGFGDSRIHHNRIYSILCDFEIRSGSPESVWITDNIFSHGVYEDVANYAVAVKRASSNGSGAVRLVAPHHNFVTGEHIAVSGLSEIKGINKTWVADVIDGDTIDLRGSAYSGKDAGVGTVSAATLRSYSAANAEFLRLDNGASTYNSVDGWFVERNLVFGKRYGVRQVSGRIDLTSFANNKWDATATAWAAEGESQFTNISWSGNIHYSYQIDETNAANPVINLASNGPASFASVRNNIFAYAQGAVVSTSGSAIAKFDFSDNNVRSWGQSLTLDKYRAFIASSPKLMLTLENNSLYGGGGGAGGEQIGFSINVDNLVARGNLVESTSTAFEVVAVRGMAGIIESNTTRGTSKLSLSDLSGRPSQILARDNAWDIPPSAYGTPNFRYSVGKQAFSGPRTQIGFSTRILDEHGDVTAGAFSAPVSGIYEFEVNVAHGDDVHVGDVWMVSIESETTSRRFFYRVASAAAQSVPPVRATLRLSRGAKVAAYVTRISGSGSLTLLGDGAANDWSGRLIGS